MTITLGTGQILDVVLCRRSEFYDYENRLPKWPAIGRSRYIAEKRDLEDLVRRRLASHWMEEDDFEVGSDGNAAWTLCGGIYSHRIICRRYLEIMHWVLAQGDAPGLWSYSTALEPVDPIDGMSYSTFLLHGNRILTRSEGLNGFDFVKQFSRSIEDAAVA